MVASKSFHILKALYATEIVYSQGWEKVSFSEVFQSIFLYGFVLNSPDQTDSSFQTPRVTVNHLTNGDLHSVFYGIKT